MNQANAQQAPTPEQLNNPKAVWVAVFFLSVAYLIYNTLPVVLGAATDSMGLNEIQMGYLGSSYMSGAVVVGISSIFWIRRFNWRYVVALSSIAVLTCYAIASFVSYELLMVAFFGIGFANGAIVSCVLSFFGDTSTPDRNFGYGVGSQVLLAGLAAYLLPIFITPSFGFPGIMLLYCAFVVATLLLLPFFPARGCRGGEALASNNSDSNTGTNTDATEHPFTYSPQAKGLLVGVFFAVGGMFIFTFGETGVWAFLDRVGLKNGLTYAQMGEAFGISLIISAAGSYLASFMGNKYGRVKPIILSTLVLIAGLLLMLYTDSVWYFGLGMLFFAGAWNFVLPFQMTLISEGDSTGRLIPLIPTSQLLGSAIGPAIAGHMVIGGSYFYVYLFAFTAAIISAALCISAEVFVYRPLKKQA